MKQSISKPLHRRLSRTVIVFAVVTLLVGLFLTASALAATPIYVRPGGDDVNCNGTADVDYPGSGGPGLACAVKTIQKGIDLVDAGGAVNVAAGSYAPSATITKAVTLRGTQAGVDARDGRPGASESIITNGGAGTFVINATDVTFDGFKFSNMTGRTIDTYFNADNFTMRNCILQGNSTYSGGAIQFGGGLSLHANGLLFEQNLVLVDNGYLFYMGHAMDDGTVRNNKFNGDSVSFGPFGARTGWLIEGNEFDGNVAGHGPYWGYGFNSNLGDVIIRNNVVRQMAVGIGQISVVNGSITGNTFDDNDYAAFQLWGGEWDSVVSSNVLIENNLIKYNGVVPSDSTFGTAAHGIRLRPAGDTLGPIDASTIHLHENAFIDLGVSAPGLAWAIRQQGSGTADAEDNWWNTTDGAAIATKIGQGTADYDPWIFSYVDDPAKAGQPGFWPIPFCTTDCYVDAATGNDANAGTSVYPFKTITKGVSMVATGGTVHVTAGVYAENVTVNKYLALAGAGSTTGGTVISGSGTGMGLYIAASGPDSAHPITISSLRVTNFSNGLQTGGVSFIDINDVVSTANTGNGLELGNGTTALALTNCELSYNTSNGVRAGTAASISGFTMDNCHVDHNNMGMVIFQTGSGASNFDNVLVKDSTFNENKQKGIYVEKLHNATFEDVVVDHSGWDTSYNFSAGVDINLKYRADYANFSFINPTITDNGVGALYGVGLTIKARDDAPSYNTFPAALTNVSITGGSVDGNQVGIRFGEPGKNNSGPTGVTISDVCFLNNITAGLLNETQTTTVAENNWWGDATGPYNATKNAAGLGNAVSDKVDFEPWTSDGCHGTVASGHWKNERTGAYNDLAGSLAVAISGDTVQAVCSDTTPVPGGATAAVSGVTIDLNGCTAGPGSPFVTVTADDVTISGPGLLDGNGSASPAVLVNSGADNLILQDLEIREWADGVEVAGTHESLKIANNWIHLNSGDGLQFNADLALSGVVTINGNLLKVNGGSGINNLSATVTIPATYNSWGDVGGPATGDGVSGLVTHTPYSFSEVFVDVTPDTAATIRNVSELSTFDVAVKVDAKGLYAVQYKLTYDPNFLTLQDSDAFLSGVQVTDGAFKGTGMCTQTVAVGSVSVYCTRFEPDADAGSVLTVSTLTFKADGPSRTGNGPWDTYLDLSVNEADLSSGARNGIKVFVNNGGFDAPSATAGRTITDTPDDGKITITGLANFTGYIDLQGRTNDSGAAVQVYNQLNIAGATLMASASSASSGKYTSAYASLQQLLIGTTYYFQVDRDLYLPTTVKYSPPATTFADSAALTTRPLTTLGTLVLLGGDATNDDFIDIGDAACIGGDYGDTPSPCGSGGNTDVNGDAKVDILDLVLMGGNFHLSSSPWTP